MQQIININGYETVIEIPEGQPGLNGFTAKAEGNENSYKIHYSENLVEIGGTTTISVNQNQNTHFEGSKTITFPVTFNTLLDYQATAIDSDKGSMFEHAHLGQVTLTGMNVYANAFTSSAKDIQVKWSVKGLVY